MERGSSFSIMGRHHRRQSPSGGASITSRSSFGTAIRRGGNHARSMNGSGTGLLLDDIYGTDTEGLGDIPGSITSRMLVLTDANDPQRTQWDYAPALNDGARVSVVETARPSASSPTASLSADSNVEAVETAEVMSDPESETRSTGSRGRKKISATSLQKRGASVERSSHSGEDVESVRSTGNRTGPPKINSMRLTSTHSFTLSRRRNGQSGNSTWRNSRHMRSQSKEIQALDLMIGNELGLNPKSKVDLFAFEVQNRLPVANMLEVRAPSSNGAVHQASNVRASFEIVDFEENVYSYGCVTVEEQAQWLKAIVTAMSLQATGPAMKRAVRAPFFLPVAGRPNVPRRRA
eukprot:scaffold7895_cov229-Pinguiococcus_pyrenoidosus.AAC.5